MYLKSYLIMFFIFLFQGSLLFAEDGKNDFTASFLYPKLTLSAKDKLNLALIIKNHSNSDETYELKILEKPDAWNAEISSSKYLLSSLFVEAKDKAVLLFSANTNAELDDLKSEYEFKVEVKNIRTNKNQIATLNVNILDTNLIRNFLDINSHFPDAMASVDAEISFAIDLHNNHYEDVLVQLEAELPFNWDYSFSSLYAADRQISSIVVPKGEPVTLLLNVIPFSKEAEGVYNIKVKAKALGEVVEEDLQVNLFGRPEIEVKPINNLLSASTEVNKQVVIPIKVINTGSKSIKNLRFIAIKVSNWDVQFRPEKIDFLNANMEEPLIVEMFVTPSADSLVGDYGLGFALRDDYNSEYNPLDFRITVTASTKWFWLGSLLIVLVIIGLALTFRKFGRR